MKQCSECKEWFSDKDQWIAVFALPYEIRMLKLRANSNLYPSDTAKEACGAECAIKAVSKAIGNLVS